MIKTSSSAWRASARDAPSRQFHSFRSRRRVWSPRPKAKSVRFGDDRGFHREISNRRISRHIRIRGFRGTSMATLIYLPAERRNVRIHQRRNHEGLSRAPVAPALVGRPPGARNGRSRRSRLRKAGSFRFGVAGPSEFVAGQEKAFNTFPR